MAERLHRSRSAAHRFAANFVTTDLDRVTPWPSFASTVHTDDAGPLVIRIDDATVYPDGSVRAHGRWVVSERFGIRPPTRRATAVTAHSGPRGFALSVRDSQVELVLTIGPRIATLSKSFPEMPVIISDTRHPVASFFDACSVTFGGYAIRGGAAHRVPAAYFARMPAETGADAQVEHFADCFRSANGESSESIYLEFNDGKGQPVFGPDILDTRLAAEQAGARLVPPNRMSVETIVRSVVDARAVTIESAELAPFGRLASRATTVSIATPLTSTKRASSRFTSSEFFDVDAALLSGQPLPRGVEVMSKPDYDVAETDVLDHRVFERSRWRVQSPDVLNEQSLGPWIISVSNAIVAPNGSVALEDGTVLAGTYFGSPRGGGGVDGWVTTEMAGRAGLALTMSKAFGHGLLQVAPRIDALRHADSSMEFLVSEYQWNDSPLLGRFDVDPGRVRRIPRTNLQHLIRVPELIVSTHLFPEQRSARADPRWADEFVERFVGDSLRLSPRRVHLARSTSSGHRGGCANREVIHELAEEFGFDTVYPETMTLDEQIALCASSTVMFGEQGSALSWSLVMPRNSRLVMVQNRSDERKDRYMTFHNPVLAARGSAFFDVGGVRAGTPAHYEVDPRTVRRALEALP